MHKHPYEVRRQGWRRSWSFIAAATGAAVGLGNLWRFSYLVGENGGSAFIVVYLVCLLLVAMPVLIAEVIIGSRGRSNPINTMQDLCLEATVSRWWQAIGWLGCLAGILVLSYYSVIAGWAFAYVDKLLSGEFVAGSAQLAGDSFNELLASPLQLMQWQGSFLLIVLLMLVAGVRISVSAVAKFLLPLLLVMLLALVVYSSRVGDFDRALQFLFEPDFSVVTAAVWLEALGHAFFTLSIGVGAMIAYGAYAPSHRPITGMVCSVVLLDTVVSLLAGLAIFPLVFSLHIAPAMGPGLLFVAMPYGFGNMIYGSYFGALFFLVVSLTSITSGVALLEPATAWLSQRFGWWRPIAAMVMVLLVWLLGLATILSFNEWQHVRLAGLSIFALLDFVTANVLLPLGGVLIALFVGWRMRKEVLRDELYVENSKIFWLWYWTLRYIAAPGVLLVFVSALYQYWLNY
jgi:NSS family neurotransmitter:Na+ symporter